jgi:hypothetical protein
LLPAGEQPNGITAGPDGNLWFTDLGGNGIGRISPAGAVTELAPPSAFSRPIAIAVGPDGNLWFTETYAGTPIGRLILPRRAATGLTIGASESAPFTSVVATFTDPNPLAQPGDFAATIDWGDGTTTTTGLVTEDAFKLFSITGGHAYADEGAGYPLRVTITDKYGVAITVTGVANVAQAPLLPTASPVAISEGQAVPAGTLVAAFTDAGGADAAGDYLALVSWGDGTAPDPATVQLNGSVFQVVTAVTHTYKDEGTYAVKVTIQDKDPTNPRAIVATVTAAGSAVVADAAPTAVAMSALPSQAKGTLLTAATVASFTDANSSAAIGDFAATIDWGDGTPTTLGTFAQPGGKGTAFTVQGSHTYLVDRAMPYTITVRVVDLGGRALTATTTEAVNDAAPLATGIPVKMTAGIAFTAPVAYIQEGIGLPPEPAGHYTATIDWGDGTAISTGAVAAIPGGNWVVGSHGYAGSGPYTITVTVHDDGGFTVVATTTAYDPPAAPAAAGRSSAPGGANPPATPIAPVASPAVPAGPLGHKCRLGRHGRPHHRSGRSPAVYRAHAGHRDRLSKCQTWYTLPRLTVRPVESLDCIAPPTRDRESAELASIGMGAGSAQSTALKPFICS